MSTKNTGEAYMQSEPLDKRVLDLFEVRQALAHCRTFDDVGKVSLEIARKRLHVQVASLFLFSKSGYLERKKIIGFDKARILIQDNWFSEEKYKIGESFTGKALVPNPNVNDSMPYWSNNLEQDDVNAESRRAYIQKLGVLKCALSVPIKGRRRTFGVLEVINKIDSKGNVITDAKITQDDIYWLSLLSTHVATTISSIRRTFEFQLFGDISKMLVVPFLPQVNSAEVFGDIATKIVDPMLPYKACVIRIADTDGTLKVVAKAGDNIVWTDELDGPVKKGRGLAGKVFAQGVREKIEDIASRSDEFKTRRWIQVNDFKSYICEPLSVDSRVIGTLSVFVGYQYTFYERDIKLLENISHLIASITESFNVMDQLRIVRGEVAKMNDKFRNGAVGVAWNLPAQQILHNYKNELLNLLNSLRESLQSSPGVRTRIIKGQIAWVEKRVEEIQNDFETSQFERVNINHVVQDVVKFFSLDKDSDFAFFTSYSRDIPDIEANEEEIREIVRNLISNAIKSTQTGRKKEGKVTIETSLITVDKIVYIQIMIEDNGIGIRNEDRNKIFTRSYSTYHGGTGMGLFITKNLVNKYGGRIIFDSTVGKGTKFSVRLPLKRLRYEEVENGNN